MQCLLVMNEAFDLILSCLMLMINKLLDGYQMELPHTGYIILQDVFFFVFFSSNLLMSRTSLEKEQSLVNTSCLDSCTACTVLNKIHSCIVGGILFDKILYAAKSAFSKLHTDFHIDHFHAL